MITTTPLGQADEASPWTADDMRTFVLSHLAFGLFACGRAC